MLLVKAGTFPDQTKDEWCYLRYMADGYAKIFVRYLDEDVVIKAADIVAVQLTDPCYGCCLTIKADGLFKEKQ